MSFPGIVKVGYNFFLKDPMAARAEETAALIEAAGGQAGPIELVPHSWTVWRSQLIATALDALASFNIDLKGREAGCEARFT